MKYADQENPRYTYYISETLNGFAIQVHNVSSDRTPGQTERIASDRVVTSFFFRFFFHHADGCGGFLLCQKQKALSLQAETRQH